MPSILDACFLVIHFEFNKLYLTQGIIFRHVLSYRQFALPNIEAECERCYRYNVDLFSRPDVAESDISA